MTDMLDNSVIVAAHPDDELLWFGAILPQVDRVVTVYEDAWFDPELGEKRRAALARYPRPIESLGLAESGAAGCADWSAPEPSDHGIAFGSHVWKRNLKQRVLSTLGRIDTPHATREAHYAANFETLVERLSPILADARNVFTHNPWGEYGHEDHVQLFRVCERLRETLNFRLWMTNYATERSLALASTYFGHGPLDHVTLPVDAGFCERAADAYRETDCWTWAHDWQWFSEERYAEAPQGQAPPGSQAHLMPLNLFNIEPVA